MANLIKRRAVLACLLGLIVLVGLAASPRTTKAAYSELDSMRYQNFFHAVSDDERYVVYSKEVEEDRGVYWLDLQTGERRLLMPYDASIYTDQLEFLIAPNADYVFVQHIRPATLAVSLRKVRVNDGQITYLIDDYAAVKGAEARFYPDGTRMVIETKDAGGQLRLLSHDLATSTLTPLPLPQPINQISQFFLQPDGEGVLLHAVSTTGQHGLYYTNTTAGAALPLQPYSAALIESPALSPDGNTLYYFVRQSDTATQLTRVRLGENPTAIGSTGLAHGSIQFSPDGRYAFYPHRLASQGSVLRLTLADDALIPLHSTNIYFATDEHLEIIVPPVGNRIVIAEANNGNSDTDIRVLSVLYDPPAPAVELTTRYGVNQLSNTKIPLLVTDDAQSVIFTEPHASHFYLSRVALDGSTAATRLYSTPVVEEVRLSQSSAGLFVQVVTEAATLPQDELYYISLTDSTPRLLYRAPKPITATTRITMHSVTAAEQIFFTIQTNRFASSYFVTSLLLANPTPAAQFDLPELATISEGTTRTITVELMPTSSTTETVGYEVISGTATLGDDFTLSPTELVFAPGQVSQTLTVTALSDVASEGFESAVLQLTGIETQPHQTMTLSFNELIGVSTAPAHLGTTSEDGRYVIFQEQQAAGVGLYSYDLVTGTRTALHAPDATLPFDGEVFLSPDSQTVLYQSDTGMRQVPRTGGTSVDLGTVNCPAKVVFSTTDPYALLNHSCILPDESPLYQLNLAAATATPLLLNAHYVVGNAIAPDGNTALYLYPSDYGNPTVYLVSTISGATQPLNFFLDRAYFTAPTTVVLVGINGIAALLDTTSRSITPLIDLETSTPYTQVRYSPQRHSLYYLNSGYEFARYQLGASAIEVLSTRYNEAWISLTANEDQMLYLNRQTGCDPYGCNPQYYYAKTHSTFTGDILWLADHAAAEDAILMQPNRQGVVYAAANYEAFAAPLYYKNFYSDAPDQRLPLIVSTNTITPFLVGDASVYGMVETALQSTRLTANGPAMTHFSDVTPPTLTRLVAGDVLLFNDAQGYLYAVADPAPRVAFATSPDILAAEGESVTVTLSLESTPLTTATVSIEVIGGTATSGSDVNAPPATLTFAPFQREASFPLTLAADGITEPVETLDIRITPLSGTSPSDATTFRLRLADSLYRQHFPLSQRSR